MKMLPVILSSALAATALAGTEISCPADAPAKVKLAAKEVRRYVYLRTGELLSIKSDKSDTCISLALDPALGAQEYRLKTSGNNLTISGGTDVAVLYGSYAFAEKLGVRFYLHGDVIPDGTIPCVLPKLDETHKPLFELRGIQPFHDFPEGPDWWTTDDYRAYISQLAKMRMNFIGLHNYPGELLLWHGVAEDVNPDGTVKTSYPSKWFSNSCSGWGYAVLKTSDFTAGAAELFATDQMVSEVAGNDNHHFDRAGKMLGTIVKDAHAGGIMVAVGTETPLHIPGPVQARLKELKKADAVREIYKGTFTWLMKNAPVDYCWAWTPEGWIWSGNSIAQYQAVETDLKAAQSALTELGNPFPLGTCGWVLGPQQNRAAWDELLPKNAAIANINPFAGHAPIDPGFSLIRNRPKWAIPWFENDPDMIAWQPWVKRMRYDAVDALRRGCTGLMGIHWRTKILAPNISALARAGWDQSWARPDLLLKGERRNPGTAATFTVPVAGTEQAPVYQTLRYGLDGYPVEVPNGTYTVTLKFNEPHYDQPGKRVFGVKVQGRNVAEHLDVFKRVSKNHAFDITVPDVRAEDGVVDITFTPEVEYPFLSGVEIAGTTVAVDQIPPQPFARRINVGGPIWQNFEADALNATDTTDGGLDRFMPADDFYQDFARAEFGENVAAAAGKVLTDADGFTTVFNPKYPGFSATTEWQGGPGALRVIREPWESLHTAHYQFVEKFAALRPQVKGGGNCERFDYWLNTLRASGMMARLACQRGALDVAMEQLIACKDPANKPRLAQVTLNLRRQLVRGWEDLIRLEIRLVSTPGELGTIANLEQHSRVNNQWLTLHDKALAEMLGEPLPADCAPAKCYSDSARLIVPTVRSVVNRGETLALKILAIDSQPVKSVTVHVRPLGHGEWQLVAAKHVARAVFQATLPPANEDFEYYISCVTGGADLPSKIHMVWPVTAPEMNQSVIVSE